MYSVGIKRLITWVKLSYKQSTTTVTLEMRSISIRSRNAWHRKSMWRKLSSMAFISGRYTLKPMTIKIIYIFQWGNASCFNNHGNGIFLLTHLPLVPYICVSELGQHWFRSCLVACSAPSHYPIQCWVIVNSTLRSKLQWKFNENKINPSRKCIWKYRLWNGGHFVKGEISYTVSLWTAVLMI